MPFSVAHTRSHQILLPAGLRSVFLGMGTVALTGLLTSSPAVAEDMDSEMGVVTLFLGPKRVGCVSVALQQYYQVRYAPEDDYQFFYSDIQGFDYEPGYDYELRILKTPVPNPPADASSINWTLVEVVSKTPAASFLSRGNICAVVIAMPSADNTDEMLALLSTDREGIMTNLEAMITNLQQYNDEGYSWQNIIDNPDALVPQSGAWLIGALRMACED